MAYAKLLNGAVVKYRYEWSDFMADNNNTQGLGSANLLTIFPQTDMAKQGYSVVDVAPSTPPTFDPITQSVVQGGPTFDTGSQHWIQTWSVVQLDPATVAANTAAAAAAAAKALAANIDALWQAANDYTQAYISGVAIGLLTIGVIQQKPKALIVSVWSSTIWADYYTRKATVTATTPASLDFSSHGPMPYSVPDLRAELGM